MNQSQQAVSQLFHSVSQSVIGQEHVVKSLLIAMLTRGHILLEGLPGTAKTRSIKSLASAMNASFSRIQFTPDLLPSDVTGSDAYKEIDGKPSLVYQPGPIFNNLVLADEINRAPAKVQAALLEAMGENTVTSAGITRELPELFLVMATQNPIEQEGTYPLPEAQMDRFTLKVDIHYPDAEAERAIIRLVRGEEPGAQTKERGIDAEHAITVTPEHIINGQKALNQVHVSEVAENYIVNLVMATRDGTDYKHAQFPQWLEVGVSPRASIALDRCARAHAWLAGRDYVDPDDIRGVIHQVMGHRLVLSYEAIAEQVTPKQIVDNILKYVPIG
ncbi:MoxR family ATPase [Shewanella benthica]|uniref:AAA family ATPase n=1 Tax=Shewanella benthica TaxID=43661 RepID=UPI001879E985|nr:MoxR family ATPase [Shewanella benthica]MBE7215936.1 MoxR family ATPase [Shewanella benthica]MCL1063628.1 MoxR family ATPase [Shewanella benthica]